MNAIAIEAVRSLDFKGKRKESSQPYRLDSCVESAIVATRLVETKGDCAEFRASRGLPPRPSCDGNNVLDGRVQTWVISG